MNANYFLVNYFKEEMVKQLPEVFTKYTRLNVYSCGLLKKKIMLLPLFIVLLNACAGKQTNKEDAMPNIVLILTDDQGWGDLSLHGNQWLSTPNTDRIAKEGAQFERFFVSPLCAPTRASLLTGRYHLRTGTASVTGGLETMRSEETTIAEVLKAAGYTTACFGKWHNGEHYPENPNGQGFNEFFGFCSGHLRNYFDPILEKNGKSVNTSGFITDIITDSALSFIKRNQDSPFFCYIPYNAPHEPFQVPDRHFDTYKAKRLDDRTAAIYGMCENMDMNIGRIMETLKKLGLDENTIVIFATDNGPNGQRYNGGMKGIKGSVDEGGTRVPLFIRWPAKIKPGTLIKQISAHIDIFPTILELCGISLPDTVFLDGKSLVPLLNNPTSSWPERSLFTHVFHSNLKPAPGAVRTSQYRLVKQGREDYLYDMLADPGQQNNVATKFPEVVDKLKTEYDQWFAGVTKKGIRQPAIQLGHTTARITKLPASEAGFSNGIRYFEGHGWAYDWLVNWTSIGDSIWWEIDAVAEGRYNVSLLYTCPEKDTGAVIRVGVWNNYLQNSVNQAFDPKLIEYQDRAPAGAVREKPWARLSFGAMYIPKGHHRMVVKAISKPGKIVIECNGIVLEKITAINH